LPQSRTIRTVPISSERLYDRLPIAAQSIPRGRRAGRPPRLRADLAAHQVYAAIGLAGKDSARSRRLRKPVMAAIAQKGLRPDLEPGERAGRRRISDREGSRGKDR